MTSGMAEEEPCFICLQAHALEGGEPTRLCRCRARVHPYCIARWQCERAGTPDEVRCRVCGADLPAWQKTAPTLGLRARWSARRRLARRCYTAIVACGSVAFFVILIVALGCYAHPYPTSSCAFVRRWWYIAPVALGATCAVIAGIVWCARDDSDADATTSETTEAM